MEQDKTQTSMYLGTVVCVVVVVVVAGLAKVRSFLRFFYTPSVTYILFVKGHVKSSDTIYLRMFGLCICMSSEIRYHHPECCRIEIIKT